MHDIIPHSPRMSTNPHKPNKGPHNDGVVVYVSTAYVVQLARQLGQMHFSLHPPTTTSTTQTAQVLIQPSKVNFVQYM